MEHDQDDNEKPQQQSEESSTASQMETSQTETSMLASSIQASTQQATQMVSTWWNSFLTTAKEKSITAIEMVKTDLTEFTTTVKHDINQVAAQNDKLFQNIPQKLQTLSQQLVTTATTATTTKTAKDQQQTSAQQSKLMTRSSQAAQAQSRPSSAGGLKSTYNRFQEDLEQLQLNEQTYLSEPLDEDYTHTWLPVYDADQNKGEISNLLIENVQLRAIYSKLVPAVISNKDFWSRYFFKIKQLEVEQKKRLDLIERATSKSTTNDDCLSWDEDEEVDDEKCKIGDSETINEVQKIENGSKAQDVLPVQVKSQALPHEDTEKEDEEEEQRDKHGSLEQSSVNNIDAYADRDEIKSVYSGSMKNADKKSLSSDEWEKEFEVSPTTEPKHTTEMSVKALHVLESTVKTPDAKDSEEWESWD